jgi:hypothetical protein
MKWSVITLFVLVATHPVDGRDEGAVTDSPARTRFEESLRWNLSAGDPSEGARIEVRGNQVKITLTGNKLWNAATAASEAKYFGLLCLLWDIQARDEDPGRYVLRDSFYVTLVQRADKVVARAVVNRTDFPTLSDLNNAILLARSQVRDILRGQAIQSSARP